MEIDDIYPVKLPNISICETERKEKLDSFFIVIASSEGLSLTLIECCWIVNTISSIFERQLFSFEKMSLYLTTKVCFLSS